MNRDNVILTDLELISLIRLSSRSNYLHVSFGGKLDNVKSNDWAFDALNEMRKNKIVI